MTDELHGGPGAFLQSAREGSTPAMQQTSRISGSNANATSVAPPRQWRHKFSDALRGIKLGVRGHSSFSVHFFFGALVLAGATVLRCSLEQWCLLLGCIGAVLATELLNSAVETMVRALDEQARVRARPCLDIAAGAVLLVSIMAALIGAAVFLRQLDIL
jgi:diacylglycerol kinase